MKKIKVSLPQNSYEINIGEGLLERVGGYLKDLGFHDKAVIITNPTVNDLYGRSLKASLEKAGFVMAVLEIPDGEEHKSLASSGKLYEWLSEFQVERLTPVLALGGGVSGDLAGFVAATYMRGVPLVQIPTTLLAQVDSSIGGKVAVNHGKLKNMIGAFYQPRLVISDISTLKTLPQDELANGLAESIKYGIIRDKGLFEIIESNIERIKMPDEDLIEEVVFRCASIKAEVVRMDEKDLGLRNILNYGHTVGHAIETVSDFQIAHGKAVAIGMVAAAMISRKMGILPEFDLARIKSLIAQAGLPVKIPALDVQRILQAMKHDKKIEGGKIRFILPKTIGEVFVSDEVPAAVVEQVLEELV